MILPHFIAQSTNRVSAQVESGLNAPEADDDEKFSPGSPSERDTFLPTSTSPSTGGPRVKKAWLTLPRAWTASHLLASIVLFSTALTRAYVPTMMLISILGISWGLTQWAPFALISVELTKKLEYDEPVKMRLMKPGEDDHAYDQEKEDAEDAYEHRSISLQAGTVMGLHNMAIATPQIIAAVASSGLFWVLARTGVPHGDAVGWVVRSGGFAGLVAAWLSLSV